MLDYLIQNATVYSGLNEPPCQVSVGIKADLIESVVDAGAPAPESRETIDAAGMILAPGFIDTHASTGYGYFFPRAADHKLVQGITTEIIGNCGTSPAPVGPHGVAAMEELSEEMGFPFQWRSLAEFFDQIRGKLQFNVATLVGHGTLRAGVMADWNVEQPEHLPQMKAALATAIEQGALGISTGLIYAPGCFAAMDELIELAKIVANHGGVYASHIRSERDEIEQAVDEALTIGKQAGVAVLISHLKAAERANWGKIRTVIEKIEAFNAAEKVKAAVDVYPYTAVSTKLHAFIPKSLLAGGFAVVGERSDTPEGILAIDDWIEKRNYDLAQMLVISTKPAEYCGKTIAEIADSLDLSFAQTIAHVLRANPETWVVYHCLDQADVDAAVMWPGSMICTDSWSYPINAPSATGQPHPRSYGAFTRFLELYVIDKEMLSWQEAIWKITSRPARFFNLDRRGEIREGYFADLVLLDPDRIKARADYLAPRELSEGVSELWINGQRVIAETRLQATTPGRILAASSPAASSPVHAAT